MKVAREREKKDDFAEIHLCIYLFARMCVKVFVKVTDEREIPVSYTHLTLPTILLV